MSDFTLPFHSDRIVRAVSRGSRSIRVDNLSLETLEIGSDAAPFHTISAAVAFAKTVARTSFRFDVSPGDYSLEEEIEIPGGVEYEMIGRGGALGPFKLAADAVNLLIFERLGVKTIRVVETGSPSFTAVVFQDSQCAGVVSDTSTQLIFIGTSLVSIDADTVAIAASSVIGPIDIVGDVIATNTQFGVPVYADRISASGSSFGGNLVSRQGSIELRQSKFASGVSIAFVGAPGLFRCDARTKANFVASGGSITNGSILEDASGGTSAPPPAVSDYHELLFLDPASPSVTYAPVYSSGRVVSETWIDGTSRVLKSVSYTYASGLVSSAVRKVFGTASEIVEQVTFSYAYEGGALASYTMTHDIGATFDQTIDQLLETDPVAIGIAYSTAYVGPLVSFELWSRSIGGSSIKRIDYVYSSGLLMGEVRKVFADNGTTVVGQITIGYSYASGSLISSTQTRDV